MGQVDFGEAFILTQFNFLAFNLLETVQVQLFLEFLFELKTVRGVSRYRFKLGTRTLEAAVSLRLLGT